MTADAAAPYAPYAHPRLAALVAAAAERAGGAPPAVAMVYPGDALALGAAAHIARHGVARPVLVGPRRVIEAAADAAGVEADRFEIVDPGSAEPVAAAQRAVRLARDGVVSALMKGSLHTDELMKPIVHRHDGLHGERRTTHVFLFDLPRYHKLLALADCVVNIHPKLPTKRDAMLNALELLRQVGVVQPKVGIVSAVETVNPAIPATVDAQALVQMAAEGLFGDAIVEGPFGFDNAISAEAARIKKLHSRVAGDADLLLVPDLNAGNMLYKSLVYLGGADCAGLVLGTRVPVVLTSRADPLSSRLASVALAVLATHPPT